MSRPLRSLVVAAGLLLALPGSLLAAPPAERGKALFRQRCVACHTIGQGDRVGPDLKGVTTRRSRAFLARFISAPDRVLAAKDPIASSLLGKYKVAMPNLGLTGADVGALIAFLQVQTAGPPGQKPAQAAPATRPLGNPARGKNLFTGATRFRNGGAPCLACHTIAGIGRLGGGKIGPDLTRASTKYGGAAGIASILATLPFPTMRPLFQGHPLTAAEQANLAAFLRQASRSERPGSAVWPLLGLAVGGAAALLALTLVVWRHRALAVRHTLLKRPPEG